MAVESFFPVSSFDFSYAEREVGLDGLEGALKRYFYVCESTRGLGISTVVLAIGMVAVVRRTVCGFTPEGWLIAYEFRFRLGLLPAFGAICSFSFFFFLFFLVLILL